jgi:hypothetical protein
MIEQIRRSNLDAVIKDRFEGNRAAFCRATGKHPNLINLILSKNPDLRRGIGERLCRSIEASLSLPDGWLDKPAHGSEGAGSVTVSIFDHDRTDEWVTLDKQSLKELTGETTSAHTAILRVKSDHMSPTVSVGDLLVLDTSDAGKKVDQSGSIYVIQKGNIPSLVRFRMTAEGWVMAFDNKAYPSTKTSQAFITRQEVVGRVIAAMTIKKL